MLKGWEICYTEKVVQKDTCLVLLLSSACRVIFSRDLLDLKRGCGRAWMVGSLWPRAAWSSEEWSDRCSLGSVCWLPCDNVCLNWLERNKSRDKGCWTVLFGILTSLRVLLSLDLADLKRGWMWTWTGWSLWSLTAWSSEGLSDSSWVGLFCCEACGNYWFNRLGGNQRIGKKI